MLGSRAEADDAVQEAWLRLNRSDAGRIDNLGAWLTTVVGRVSLNMLRARRARREEPLPEHEPEPIDEGLDPADPEHEALLADSVGLALLVVLEMLTPAERLAFVLHDMFAVPFDEIATIVDRSPDAARQLASRGRRRVQGATPTHEADPREQREIVEAFLAAARNGDFDALLALLDPDVVLRADMGVGPVQVIRGAEAVVSQARAYSQLGLVPRRALVDGIPAWISTREGELFSVAAFGLRDGKIVSLYFLSDPARLERLDIRFLDD
jgi:RNA polymerase sigma-70 factor (ECF subfamily)